MTREFYLLVLIIVMAIVDHVPLVIIKAGLFYPLLHYGCWFSVIYLGIVNVLKAQAYRYWLKKRTKFNTKDLLDLPVILVIYGALFQHGLGDRERGLQAGQRVQAVGLLRAVLLGLDDEHALLRDAAVAQGQQALF